MTDKVKNGDILVGLDIGTHKTYAVIGEVTENEDDPKLKELNVIGVGSAVSKGIQKGNITNVDSAAQCINEAIEKAEVTANCKISSVIVNITGNHIKGRNSQGLTTLKNDEITDGDIAACLESAKAIPIPPDREFLHVLAQEYILDETQRGIKNPKGMSGVRLEANVHIVTAASSAVQNIIKSIQRYKIDVADIVLSSLASSEAVLSRDEKELGCVLIDIGGGTTDVAIWVKGALVHNYVLPLGGNHLTNDIAQSLQISVIDAERLKLQSGCAMTSAVGTDEIVLIPMPGGRDPKKRPKQVIAEIIQPRLEEIFEMVAKEIEKSGHKEEIPAGIILTGGTARMDAVPELAESIFGMPVRRGIPTGIGGITDFVQNPQCATVIGLLLHAMNQHDIASYSPQDEKNNSLLGRFVSWLKQIV